MNEINIEDRIKKLHIDIEDLKEKNQKLSMKLISNSIISLVIIIFLIILVNPFSGIELIENNPYGNLVIFLAMIIFCLIIILNIAFLYEKNQLP